VRTLAALAALAAGGLFGYDASAPLAWRDAGAVDTRDGITVRDVSYGAYVVWTAAGADGRSAAVVLDSGAGRWSRAAREFCHPAAKSVASLRTIDPLSWIGRSRAAVLVQNGTRDPLTRRAELAALARAARTRMHWYDALHPLNERAFADRTAFLVRELR
jgi:hypothetical protein